MARNKVTRRLGVGRGCPLPTGEGYREVAMPLSNFFSIFEFKMANFGAFWVLLSLQLNCLTCISR